MIGKIKGKVIEKSPPWLTIDISGLGFIVYMPASAFSKITTGQEIEVFTKYLIKEEEAFLYGFLTRDELAIFEELISVPGIGPKSGLTLLSNFTPEELARAIEEENIGLLSSVPKIGQKLASKIILELKGKMQFKKESTTFDQAVNALCSLGLNRAEAISRLKGLPNNLSVEEMVKLALRSQ